MQDSDFYKIQYALRTASGEPEGVPPELMTSVRKRCQAVAAGREAERRLKSGGDIAAEEIYELTAAGIIGRAAMRKNLPEGQNVTDMISRFSKSARLRGRLNGTAENALRTVESDLFLRGPAGGREEPERKNVGQPKKSAENKGELRK